MYEMVCLVTTALSSIFQGVLHHLLVPVLYDEQNGPDHKSKVHKRSNEAKHLCISGCVCMCVHAHTHMCEIVCRGFNRMQVHDCACTSLRGKLNYQHTTRTASRPGQNILEE